MQKALAPWTPEQVDTLNRYQRAGGFHEFTCHSGHRLYATEAGWRCPYCVWYEQNWAWAFMATKSIVDEMIRYANEGGGYSS